MPKKTSRKFFRKYIKDEIFGGNFELIVCEYNKFLKWFKKKHPEYHEMFDDITEGCDARFIALENEREIKTYIVWLPDFNYNSYWIECLTHELTHLARRRLLTDCNIPLCYETDEVYAYYISTRLAECLEALEKYIN